MRERDRKGVKECERTEGREREGERKRRGSRVVKREMHERRNGKNMKMKESVVDVLPWQ